MVSIRKFISFLGVFISLFKQANIEAYFYKLDTVKSPEQTIHLLSDLHAVEHSNKQREEILAIIKERSGALIVEDSSICVGTDLHTKVSTKLYDYVLSEEEINRIKARYNSPAPMFLLHSQACHAKVASKNIEFRFPDRRSLKNLFESIDAKLQRLENELQGSELYPAFKLLADDAQEYMRILGPVLNKLRASNKTIEEFIKTEEFFLTEEMIKLFYGPDATLADCPFPKETTLEDAVGLISVLVVDAEVIGALHALKDHHTVFVCMGGQHIGNLLIALQKIPVHVVYSEVGDQPTGISKDRLMINLAQAFPKINPATPEQTLIVQAPTILTTLQNLIYSAIRVISQLFVG